MEQGVQENSNETSDAPRRLAQAVLDASDAFRSACVSSGTFPSPPTWIKDPTTGCAIVFMTGRQFERCRELEKESAVAGRLEVAERRRTVAGNYYGTGFSAARDTDGSLRVTSLLEVSLDGGIPRLDQRDEIEGCE